MRSPEPRPLGVDSSSRRDGGCRRQRAVSPKPPDFELFDRFPLTDNHREATEKVADAISSRGPLRPSLETGDRALRPVDASPTVVSMTRASASSLMSQMCTRSLLAENAFAIDPAAREAGSRCPAGRSHRLPAALRCGSRLDCAPSGRSGKRCRTPASIAGKTRFLGDRKGRGPCDEAVGSSASSTPMSCGKHRSCRPNQPACGRVPWLHIGDVPRVGGHTVVDQAGELGSR